MNKNTVLLLFVLLLSLAILSGCGSGSGSFVDRISAGSYYVEDGPVENVTREEILEDRILDLEDEKAELSHTVSEYEEDIGNTIIPLDTLSCYFNEDEDTTFEQARDAFTELKNILKKYYQ